ncbi:OmpL47-type beta-barrel domain-containing protein [Mesobacillus subterraneus]|uniref:Fibronectin type-III domain-containing protein n=1 Tax=Mesobacillus subterraneus TaxID=285983 RepID=A0A3R9EYP2_9BACI|nr:hypothetical protein [Mesobacillus subterraneus]RSD25196.1 hypothetical protein EJA10_18190 [Mesobacillus subterraneus]
MKNFVNRKLIFLALILITSQIFFPLVNAFASSTALPPSNLATQYITPDDVKLTWSSVYGATGYNVYEITEGKLILRDRTTAPSYTLNNLDEGSYRFVVSTLSSEGESGPSAPISFDVVYPEMSAPATLTQAVSNGNDLTLSWGAAQYAEKYLLYQISEAAEPTLIASTAARTYKLTNLAEGNYTYAVSASHSLYGESALSPKVKLDLTHPEMTAPNNFNYSISNGTEINLKWNAVSFATNYKLYEIKDNEKALTNTVTGTNLKLTGMAAGEYFYEIRSNSDRFGESAEGSQLKVTIGDVVMAAPGNVTYSFKNINDIVLAWESVPQATSYKIYQQVNEEKILRGTVTGTSYTVPNAPEDEYQYEIHSFSSTYGESEIGGKVKVPVIHPVMVPPLNVKGTVKDDKDLTITWDTAENATNYRVYQIVNGQKTLKSTVSATSVTYTNLTPGEYMYAVHSYSSRFGESAEGTPLTETVKGKTMLSPANLTHTVLNGNDIKLSWTAAENATNYKIYQVVDGQKTLKNTITGTTITYTNLPEGDYYYLVHSNSSLFGESETGSEMKLTMIHPTMESPQELTYKLNNGNDVALSWSAAQYATAYKVYQLIDGVKVLKYNGSALSATISKLPVGEHTFIVHSVSSRFGESREGNKISININEYTMEAPENLTHTISNVNTLSLKWDAVLYANRYKVYEVVDGQRFLKATVTGTTAAISNIPEGKRHYVIHSESDRFGESPKGAPVAIEIVFPVIQAPENLTYSIKNGNDVVLAWSAAPYATSYKVYEKIDGQKILKATATGLSATITNITEGEHSYIVHTVSSRFGESEEGSDVTIDIVYPSMQEPENLTHTITNGNDITLKWNASLYATSYKVYQILGSEKVLKTTVTGTSAVLTNMPEGKYSFEIHSFSTRFGESVQGTGNSFELVFPIMQAPSNFSHSITNGNDIVLRWNSTSFATSYKVYRIIDGKKELLRTLTGTAVTFTNMPEGNYEYEVHSVSSRFGESPEASKLNFELSWPVVQPPQVSGTVFNVNNITLAWPAVTWANEYRVYKLNDGGKELIYKGTALNYKVYNLTEKTHSFEVTAYSTRFGESNPSNKITEKIIYPIMEPPAAELKLLSESSARIYWDFVTYANGYNIYELLDGKPVLVAANVNNLSYTLTDLTYANHEYYVTSYSNSFGESEPSNIVLAKLIVDTQAPVTSSNIKNDWSNESVSVKLTASDDETGVAATYYSVNGSGFVEGITAIVSGEGLHQIAYYSVDRAGNKEEVKTETVKIDFQAPNTISNMDANWKRDSFTVELNAEDGLSGVSKTYYSVNGEDFTEGNTLILTEDGAYQVSYFSKDLAGNTEAVKTEIVKIDKSAPVTAANAQEEWYKSDAKIELTSQDSFSGVDTAYYSINGSEFVEGDNFILSEEGVHKVSYFSTDQAGNKEEVQVIYVKVDKTAPVITTEFDDEYVLGTSLAIKYIAADKYSGIKSEEITVNDIEYNNGESLTLDIPGIYTVKIKVTDHAGWTTTYEKNFGVYVPIELEVLPKVIKGNKGIFTVKAILPEAYQDLFDVSSVTLNGVAPVMDNTGLLKQAEKGHFKFERENFDWDPGQVKLELRGYLSDGNHVFGTKLVDVK